MSGFDAELVLHLHEPDHEAALRATTVACQALEALGYSVTQRPALPSGLVSSLPDVEYGDQGDEWSPGDGSDE